MNDSFIVELIEPYVHHGVISEKDFESVFDFLDLHEKYEVIDVLIHRSIEISYEEPFANKTESMVMIRKANEKIIDVRKIEYNSLPLEKSELKRISLTNEELCIMYQRGDKRCLAALFIKNKKFIWKLAIKYSGYYSHKLTEEDLVEYGFFGLREAAGKFDSSLGNAFLTYAGHWIRQSITRAIADHGFTIRIPVHMFDRINRVRAIIHSNEFESEQAMIAFISKQQNLTEDKVVECIQLAKNILKPTSLDIKIGEDGDSELIDFLTSHEKSVEEQVLANDMRECLLHCMEILKPKEVDILKKRFGFGCEPMTLEEVGREYEVTRERIRQIEAKAIQRLKRNRITKDLKVYLGEEIHA